jgi:N-acetylmuramoyl-L-alanine amidase
MVLHQMMIKILVVSLFAISMFIGTETNSYANSTETETVVEQDKLKIGLEQSIKEIDENLNLSTSKVLLENNEELDKIVKSNELTIDSIVDSQKESPIGLKSYSNKEIEMMAKMVHGEARGEALKGKVAVAAVILNRVESPEFPDTVGNVLFQDGAFTAVIDGQYNKSPEYDAYQAVYLAINGMDPTKDAIFYYNPTIATSDWIFSRPQTTKIGQHVFAK